MRQDPSIENSETKKLIRRKGRTCKGGDGIDRTVEATDGEAAEALSATGHGPQA